jgi:hypothetical protein
VGYFNRKRYADRCAHQFSECFLFGDTGLKRLRQQYGNILE